MCGHRTRESVRPQGFCCGLSTLILRVRSESIFQPCCGGEGCDGALRRYTQLQQFFEVLKANQKELRKSVQLTTDQKGETLEQA